MEFVKEIVDLTVGRSFKLRLPVLNTMQSPT